MPRGRAQEFLDYIGANVGRARARVGMTQEQLAEAADLDLRFVQRVERGKTNLSINVLVALAEALGVQPTALLRKAVLPQPKRGRPPTARRMVKPAPRR